MLAAYKNWLFRRKLEKQVAQATSEIKKKWIYFNNAMSFNDGVTLSKRIDLFTMPIMEFMERSYPLLIVRPDMFWMIFWTAIFESNTHPHSDLKEAQKEMHANYVAGTGLHSDHD